MSTDTNNNQNNDNTDKTFTLDVSLDPSTDILQLLDETNNTENKNNVDDDNDTNMLNNDIAPTTDNTIMDDAQVTLAMSSPSQESTLKLANDALNKDPFQKAKDYKEKFDEKLRLRNDANYDNASNASANHKLIEIFNEREAHYKDLLREKDFIIRNENIERSFMIEYMSHLRGVVKRLKAHLEKVEKRGVDMNKGLGAANKKVESKKSMIIPKKVNNGLHNNTNGNNSKINKMKPMSKAAN